MASATATDDFLWLLPLILGVAAFVMIALVPHEAFRLKYAYLWVVPASILLAYAGAFLGLCGLAENRSDLYNARCESSVPWWPLLGIPVLCLLPLAFRRMPGVFVWAVGAFVVLLSVYVPLKMLSV